MYFWGHPDPDRPYDAHYLRGRLDGTGYSRLTEAAGNHQILLSPSKKFFVDTHSSACRLPAVELRRSDGALVRALGRSMLRDGGELHWKPPEEIVTKAADGETDLYEYALNETHIDRLEGKLLFMSGTSDYSYPELLWLLEAFVQAGKPYDFVLLPDRNHDIGNVPGDAATEYYWEAIRRYFQEHLKSDIN